MSDFELKSEAELEEMSTVDLRVYKSRLGAAVAAGRTLRTAPAAPPVQEVGHPYFTPDELRAIATCSWALGGPGIQVPVPEIEVQRSVHDKARAALHEGEREGATPDDERWWGDVPSFDAVPVHLLVSKLDELQLVWPASASAADIKRHVAEAVAEWRAVAEAQPKAQAEGGQPAVGNDEGEGGMSDERFDAPLSITRYQCQACGAICHKVRWNGCDTCGKSYESGRFVRRVFALADAEGEAPSPVLYDELREASAKARKAIETAYDVLDLQKVGPCHGEQDAGERGDAAQRKITTLDYLAAALAALVPSEAVSANEWTVLGLVRVQGADGKPVGPDVAAKIEAALSDSERPCSPAPIPKEDR